MITMTELGKFGKAPAIWFDVAGYVTNITELGEIFGIHMVTLRNRLRSGWNIVPACLVGNTASMTLLEVSANANQATLEQEFINKLHKHFGRPSHTMLKGE